MLTCKWCHLRCVWLVEWDGPSLHHLLISHSLFDLWNEIRLMHHHLISHRLIISTSTRNRVIPPNLRNKPMRHTTSSRIEWLLKPNSLLDSQTFENVSLTAMGQVFFSREESNFSKKNPTAEFIAATRKLETLIYYNCWSITIHLGHLGPLNR